MSVDPPRPRGPQLNALRAFEAAARLGGFAAAAQELSVTPAAVAQQVRALEDWAGAALFERRSRGVTLSTLGAEVAEEFTAAFDTLADAQRRLGARAARRTVTIAALPSVAQLWLAPRLPRLRARLPEHALSVVALERPPNLRREMFDLSVFVRAPSRAPRERVLRRDVIFPVCAPSIAERLETPADLAGETLLVDASWKRDWSDWLERAGVGEVRGRRRSTFSLYSLALEEARRGAGVLIGHAFLVEADLAAARLVAPFACRVGTGRALIVETAGPVDPASTLDTAIDVLTRSDLPAL